MEELPSAKAGLPLGVAADSGTGEHEVHPLHPGDAVLLYTDGAIETRNADEEQFGLERLMEAFERSTGTPDERLAQVDAAVAAHRGDGPVEDDQTLLMFQVDG